MEWKDLIVQRRGYTNFYLKHYMRAFTWLTGRNRGATRAQRAALVATHACWLLTFGALAADLGAALARSDLVLAGDDLCVLLGIGLIAFKFACAARARAALAELVRRLSAVALDAARDDGALVREQERYALLDCATMYAFHPLAAALFVVFAALAPDAGELPFRALLPFEAKSGFAFYAMYACQSHALFFVLVSILVVDQVCGELWHRIALQYALLRIEFERLGDECHGRSASVTEDRLRVLIARHQFAIELADKMNSITSPMLSAQIFASNFMICLTGFEATLTFRHDRKIFAKFLMYLGAALGQLGYWCLYGNFVQHESSSLAQAACSCALGLLRSSRDPRAAKSARFVVMRAQRPVRMMASGLYVLNLQTFLSILRGSYSFFTLLRSLNDM